MKCERWTTPSVAYGYPVNYNTRLSKGAICDDKGIRDAEWSQRELSKLYRSGPLTPKKEAPQWLK